MMISNEISASPDSVQWQSINWKRAEQHVLKLQMRIAKATREGKHGKAKPYNGYHSSSFGKVTCRKTSITK